MSVTHLKRLLLNIAGNAVKYNRQGGYVRLVCREVEPADGAPVYEYTIADNGIGMSEEFQQHLYEPFCREEQQVEGASSGTGLGAPIAKQLVELMGGTMSFTSVLGQGTTFTIRLPFEKCKRSEIPQAVRADAGDGDALQGLHVLLVEDNDLNAEIAQFTLSRAGAVVTHAKDGESAVEAFAASAPHEYDVVLMDIMMPGIDGLEATRRIRALDREDAATTPIIAVSANAFADDRRLSREAGMDAHLSKPVNSQELVEALAHIAADVARIRGWGFRLLKHDYSTFDIFGRYGIDMTERLTDGDWCFFDRSRTTAEIVLLMYEIILENAGDMVIMGCNTLSHLCAGLVHINRTGDDTSGREWERTRRLGVNTMAFRLCQNNRFYVADADCAGITPAVPWSYNKQWVRLLGESGTPLFVSSKPGDMDEEQMAFVAEMFRKSARQTDVLEPLDWTVNTCPQRWRINGEEVRFDFFDKEPNDFLP